MGVECCVWWQFEVVQGKMVEGSVWGMCVGVCVSFGWGEGAAAMVEKGVGREVRRSSRMDMSGDGAQTEEGEKKVSSSSPDRERVCERVHAAGGEAARAKEREESKAVQRES